MSKYLILFLYISISLKLSAQEKVLADKIIGQVGERIILYSDIKNEMADMQRQGVPLPQNATCTLLQNNVMGKVLLLQAERDTLLKIDDESLEVDLDNQIRGFIQMYGSKEALEEVAGKTVYQIKEDFKQPFKERKLIDMMRNKIVESIKITPTEVKAYFDSIPKDSLLFYESAIEIAQVVMHPKANKDVDNYTISELQEYKRQIEQDHKPFELLAKLYSEDPGSKDNGGQYTLNRDDKFWDPAFLSTAFRLKEGQISQPVKSKFGYHLIQLVKRNGDDAIVRHILKIPSVGEEEVQLSIKTLDSIRSQIIAGKLNFGEAVNRYTTDEDAKFTAGFISNQNGSTLINIDRLDKDLVLMLKDMKVGDISQPTTYTDARNRKAVRIIYLKTRTEPHRENLKDDYSLIAQRALEEKKNRTLQKWLEQKIANYYIYIDDEYAQCSSVKQLIPPTAVLK